MEVNSKLVNEFVAREVFVCISDMSEYLFGWEDNKYAPFDEWENLYEPHCPECGCELDIADSSNQIKCPYCSCSLDSDSLNLYPAEIFEYWLVSDYLGRKLRENGEPTYERYGAWIWGRKCTGQAITLDCIINKIVMKEV